MYKTILSLLLGLMLAVSGLAQERYISADAAAAKLFNPDISVVVDGIYYNYSGDEAPAHIWEELPGFGHGHGPGDDHDHDHEHGLEKGFNLRHLELMLLADVDPYFKGWATVAVDTHGAELEEAVIQTTCLPWGTQIKLGKFFSEFTRINAQHAHAWNFTDAPLIHQLFFGEHGINDKGVQLSWLAPTPFFLQFGAEAFQGENEAAFDYHPATGRLRGLGPASGGTSGPDRAR
ncbi:MAG: hypothetical protein LC725_07400 [Lentisphaerae bacterium]|nr:hypothetical protein [Lentisphaerota bacterium]